ncbi:hypothetical protein [Sediminitomix flava]|uniref:YD repeat-containing protein n=1 Tax=Sediminitomix flava TaxID=379075 RepID=A0A315ZAR1_SEDFL|nr:hypothetical protein [Sediminitomix flava]PWJ42143.1 hypothetical protein BC781_103393 [Sediminitomix flava]
MRLRNISWILVLIPLVALRPFKDKKESDRSKMGLKGNVKSIEVEYGKVTNENGVWKLGEKPFNNAKEKTTFLPSGNIALKTIFSSSGDQQYKFQYFYKGDQLDSMLQYYSEDEPTYKTIYEFSKDKPSQLLSSVLYEFVDNTKAGKTDYFYDKKGNLIGRKNMNSADETNVEEVFEYKKRQKVRYKKYIASEQYTIIQEYEYNKQKLVSQILSKSITGQVQTKKVLAYDENGNLLSSRIYNPDDQLAEERTFEYTFDDKGNWVQKVVIENGEPYFMTVRKIEYFN